MPVTFTIADNADGTGAVVTVAGSTAGSTNTFYVQAVDGELGTSTWSTPGNRTSDGTIAITTDVGYYFGYVHSNAAGTVTLSPLVYFNITDGDTSVHYRCMTAAQSRIQGLLLDGISNSDIIVRKMGTDRNIGVEFITRYPAIILSSNGIEDQPPNAGTNIRDDVGYPVICSVIAKDQVELEKNHEKYLKWREQINRAFRGQRLPGVSEIYIGRVQPAQIADIPSWLAGKFHTSLILRFYSREVRGI